MSRLVILMCCICFSTSCFARILLWSPKQGSKDFSDIGNWIVVGAGNHAPDENDDINFGQGNKDAEIRGLQKIKSLFISDDYTGSIHLENPPAALAITTLKVGKVGVANAGSDLKGGEIHVEGDNLIHFVNCNVEFKGTQIIYDPEVGDDNRRPEMKIEDDALVEIDNASAVTLIENTKIMINEGAMLSVEKNSLGLKTDEIQLDAGVLRVRNGNNILPPTSLDVRFVGVSNEGAVRIASDGDLVLLFENGMGLQQESLLEIDAYFDDRVDIEGKVFMFDSTLALKGGEVLFDADSSKPVSLEGDSTLEVFRSTRASGKLILEDKNNKIPKVFFIHDNDTRELTWAGDVTITDAVIEMNEHYGFPFSPNHDVFRIIGDLVLGFDVNFKYYHTGNYNIQDPPAFFFEVWENLFGDFATVKHGDTGAPLSNTHEYGWEVDPITGDNVFVTQFDPV